LLILFGHSETLRQNPVTCVDNSCRGVSRAAVLHPEKECEVARMIAIEPAQFPRDLPVVETLFREYADGLEIDLSFQDFESELAALPGKYAPPAGRLLLAWKGSQALGCVALRPISSDTCEMKRLYVRPAARGEQWGRRLAERICDEARAAGYRRVSLDTLPSMRAAVRLYTSMGFRLVEPYAFNPIPGAMFLERVLSNAP